jgi:4-aminobutyrate aminotransferase-like enzyme/Ser/Thr protein kinase RdoA (MazF antagonist)
MQSFTKPQLSNQGILKCLQENYQLQGELTELAGYCDVNLMLKTATGERYIVKISCGLDSFSNLQMQNQAMKHLYDTGLAVPYALANQQGSDISVIQTDQGDTFNYRVLIYLQGVFYADSVTANHQSDLWQSLGTMIGQVDQQLASFSHPDVYRYLEWDLAQGFAICQTKKHLLKAELLPLIDSFLGSYQVKVLPLLGQLPQGIIHNDANDYNVLVDDKNAPHSVTGLIDFGDVVYSHLINELAITAAYAIMGVDEPLQTIKHLVIGYHQHRPLSALEIKVLLPLISLRLCTSICNAALAIKNQPDNEYILVSVDAAVTALQNLNSLNFLAAELSLLNSCGLNTSRGKSHQQIIDFRQQHLGKTLSLSFEEPIKIIQGRGAFLYDEKGVEYLDMVNNVCHVGHCHPKVVAAGQKQMAELNTNTRFLHDNIIDFSEKLLATLPDSLSVCMFVNSGSEANELAFRLAENYSSSKELIVVDGAYHGNTAACIKASPYKFDGPGGKGAETTIHQVELPDPYSGKYQGNNIKTAMAYAEDVQRAITEIEQEGNKLGAYICESLQGVAGQIIMPDGYLKAVYEKVRAAGGVCIADEVQVGFGRVGTSMWAFETQDVVPDILTLGKPIGNGHPLAAVIMTKEIADAFVNGMEYFNTFGGNPVSCAIGSAVLDVIEEEKLMENALTIGQYFMDKLRQLQTEFQLIGDVRGLGLFIGVELVEDRVTKQPATKQMNWLIEYFKENSILMSSEGPGYNVLKIKPPIVFSKLNVNRFINIFRQGLVELAK